MSTCTVGLGPSNFISRLLAASGSQQQTSPICPKLDGPVFDKDQNIETADLCMGWFWGPDYFFSNLEGVKEVVVGYAGGKQEWPTYKSIKDHTEAVRVIYDASKISYGDILRHFILEQDGPPSSPAYSRQYRSAVLVHNSDQRNKAEQLIDNLCKSMQLSSRKNIFIDIEDATDFYKAEEYHQKFYTKQGRGRGRM